MLVGHIVSVAVMAIDVAEVASTTPLTLDEAYRTYGPFVARTAHRLLGRDSDVDDVVQDVFLDAMKGLRQLREAYAIRAWLRTVTVRKCRRRLSVRRLKGMLGFDDAPEYANVATAETSPEDRAMIGRVYAALDGVSTEERLAWVLRFIEEEKLEDVATLCGCSLATAKRRIAAADRHVREQLTHG